MDKNIKSELDAILGASGHDRFTAKFYMHQVPDGNHHTILSAMERADTEARRREQRTGRPVDPNYTPQNLIRLGAEHHLISVPYVEIKRVGARDFNSSIVTDEHKQRFPLEWAEFERENHADIYQERQDIQVTEDRPEHSSQGGSWSAGVSYTAPAYSLNFTLG